MKNLKLGSKLIGGFAVVAAIVLAVGVVGFIGILQMQDHIREIGDVRLPSIESLQEIEIQANAIRTAVRSLLNPRMSLADRQRQYENIAKARTKYEEAWAIYEPLPQTEEESRVWQQFVTAWDQWRVQNNAFVQHTQRIEETDILNPDDLGGLIQSFISDHYILMDKVSQFLLTGTSFSGGDDPTQCNFGKWMAGYETTNPNVQAVLRDVRQYHDPFHTNIARLKDAMNAGNQDEALRIFNEEIRPNAEMVFAQFDRLFAEAEGVINTYDEVSRDALTIGVEKQAAAMGLLHRLIEINEEVSDEARLAASQDGARVQTLALAGVIVGVILAFLLGIVLTRGITKPVSMGVEFAQFMAQGDMTRELAVRQRDEIGVLADAMREMVDRVSGVVQDVQGGADNVTSGSQAMSSTAQQMSQGATEQAAAAEEVSSSMEEMGSNIRQNADNAMQTEKIAQKAAQDAQEGGQAVEETVEAMKQIADRISIIEEIARNTNLLALNAAIEAARAGEHGKGFAVVASEVRKLAENSQKAAGEISELSTKSVSVAEKAGQMLKQIVPDIQKTAELVQEISAASAEQNNGAEQVNKAVLQLDQVIQQNASASEEMASMAEELSSQAEQLQAAVAFFRVKGGSGNKALQIEHAPQAAVATGRASAAGKKGESAGRAGSTGITLRNDSDHDDGTRNRGRKSEGRAEELVAQGVGKDDTDKDFEEF